jgi:Domain of unknown function (DUF1844)
MSEEKKSFTVTDKRHFTREGEVREEAPTAPDAKAADPPAPPPAAPAPGVSRVVPASTPPPDPAHVRAEASYRQASAGTNQEDEQGGLDFVGLLLSLGTQASMMLGGGRGPGERPGPPDLPGARSIISLLEILAEKTVGRRTPEEDEVLDGLLYELRMQYVALTTRKGGS